MPSTPVMDTPAAVFAHAPELVMNACGVRGDLGRVVPVGGSTISAAAARFPAIESTTRIVGCWP